MYLSKNDNETSFFLMGWDLILINGFEIFFKNSERVRILFYPTPIIYKIKFILNFKIKLI